MKQPVGIFDSGVGGLTVYKAIKKALPEENIIYFGDTARVPYGPKSENTIIKYSLQNARFLLQKNIKILVVACNTSSALALPELEKITNIPVIGVIQPGAKLAAESTLNNRIGVIGTEGTIRSEAYNKAIKAILPEAEIFSYACPLFVPLVEEGWIQHPATKLIAEQYLSYFKDKNIDTLVLGCTHYPLLKSLIDEIMEHKVKLIDSADAIALHLKTLLPVEEHNEPGIDRFYVSDNEAKFSEIAEYILGVKPTPVKSVHLYESWFE
ncbi:MAG: glutamate racemase [Candidatus Cloacimonetes bacterium]|jgi:glutamate racemase|nr:glutamate racemase [Candidatus Cloacimonadota bacterium]